LLRFRRSHPATFLGGSYEPLVPTGEHAHHLIAFARGDESRCVITVVPRLVANLDGAGGGLPLGAGVWGTTRLRVPTGTASYANLLTGEVVDVEEVEGFPTVPLSSVFETCPVAVLVS
jgi:(1->4)-alpha-D-glucan 1-alpha-D-glucosylmutase